MGRRDLRRVEYEVEDNYLVEIVTLPDGREYSGGYSHRCTREVYEQVAHAVEEYAENGFTGDQLADNEKLPYTQVHTAVAFMKERGCLETRHKRNYPSSSFTFEDAMIEYFVLAEGEDTQT